MKHWMNMLGKFLVLSMLVMSISPAISMAAEDLYETLQILKFDEPTEVPDFSLASVDGGEKKLSDFKGQFVLLNFWATWCAYCRSERAALQTIYELYQEKGLEIVSVSIDRGSIDPVKAFVKEQQLTFPNLHDPTIEVGLQYAARVIPMTYFVNRSGKAIGVAIGPRTWEGDDMKSLLATMLEEKESLDDGAATSEQADATSSATPKAHEADSSAKQE